MVCVCVACMSMVDAIREKKKTFFSFCCFRIELIKFSGCRFLPFISMRWLIRRSHGTVNNVWMYNNWNCLCRFGDSVHVIVELRNGHAESGLCRCFANNGEYGPRCSAATDVFERQRMSTGSQYEIINDNRILLRQDGRTGKFLQSKGN